MPALRTTGAAVLAAALVIAGTARAAEPGLVLENKIALGEVSGRIDHLAFDPVRQLLFVAELGNDSVGVIDLKTGKVMRRLDKLREPQGLAWHEATATLYVANAADGSIRLYQGNDLTPAGQIALGDDADNIRLDRWRDRIVVGYGRGALAVIDPKARRKMAEIALKGHPESFQFDEEGRRIFANVPDARQVAVIDLEAGRQISAFDLAGARSNFPMALDAAAHRLLVVTRSPARLLAFDTQAAKGPTSVEACSDADDVFVDAKRRRVYVTCGEGAIDVFDAKDGSYGRVGRIATISGARTGLFVPELDRLFLAVRASGRTPAAVWVYRPDP